MSRLGLYKVAKFSQGSSSVQQERMLRMSWNSAEASAYVPYLLLLCQGSKWSLMVRASDQYSSGLEFESSR